MSKQYPYHTYYYPSDFKEELEQFEFRVNNYEQEEKNIKTQEKVETVQKYCNTLDSIINHVENHNYDLRFLSNALKNFSNTTSLDDWLRREGNSLDEKLFFIVGKQEQIKKMISDIQNFRDAAKHVAFKLQYGRAGGDQHDITVIIHRIGRVEDNLKKLLIRSDIEDWALSDRVAMIKTALSKAYFKIKNKNELDAFLAFYSQLGVYIDLHNEKSIEFKKKILGLSNDDLWLSNFDLNNTEDIKRCKKLYPLAKQYPDLFYGWYDNKGNILFEPTYSNGLERKRKEINAKLTEKKHQSTNAFKKAILKFAAKVIVPEKLGKRTAKTEQKIADLIFKKRQSEKQQN